MTALYATKDTWITHVNPSIKLILSILLFAYMIFIHNPTHLVYLTAVFCLLLFVFSGHPLRYLLLFSAPFILVFFSSASSMIFFGRGDTTWFKWGIFHVTEESFYRGVHLGFRALAFAILGMIFALTTKPVLLFYSLMQQLKVPSKYAYSFLASIRIIPIMIEEFQTLRHAMVIRQAVPEKGLKGVYKKLQFFSVPLLAQSIRRAQRIAVAMEAKRFMQVKQRTYYYQTRITYYDLIFLIVLVSAPLATYMLADLFPLFDNTDVRYTNS
ncbi:energy-coupling factor transporter transmembrane component T family protein [Alkalicoccobacillus plakortidis]|uniref:Energy-coupling factor transporter transmembrane protein EcfT n=1 Tax=Alkalicoccobacillus plakortidis TaxID=444060 RepID=A0ABT0XH50_9BACI|nr:energy-coupling factor transporter transmembrane component T [Alkalicoccobacillus plakortidis]MCM2674534.1 energy-coupling factor transporter transmembrane protein EcfT [Alkalicoccobacillus plakortidis]